MFDIDIEINLGDMVTCHPYDWSFGWDNEADKTVTRLVIDPRGPDHNPLRGAVYVERGTGGWWVERSDIISVEAPDMSPKAVVSRALLQEAG